MRGFEDTWRWDERAARRVAEIESAVSHPLHTAAGAFRALLGESGMLAYLTYMGERLVEMRRLLKPTGSIYLHCDPTASHYLKALMDAVFGARHFRNEIAWCYTGPGNVRRWFPRKHDVLLFYACSDNAVFNRDAVRIPYKQLNVQHPDEETGGGIGGRLTPDNVEEYRGRGKVPEDYWLEDRDGMSPVSRRQSERLGYPTQKPLALLERIIRASSNEGELVLDPFCAAEPPSSPRTASGGAGSASTSRRRRSTSSRSAGSNRRASRPRRSGCRRRWRTRASSPPRSPSRSSAGRSSASPASRPTSRQRGDGGIDGQGTLTATPENHGSRRVLAQVKGGRFSLSQFRDFLHVVEHGQAACGVYISLDPVTSRQARALAAAQGEISVVDSPGRYPRVQLWSIAPTSGTAGCPRCRSSPTRTPARRLAIERRMLR